MQIICTMKEEQLKHLEFIQGVITRMGSNSFYIKGWTITLVAALLALYSSRPNVAYLFVGLVPVVVFWFLDSYYLWQERRFRGLYNDAAGLTEHKVPVFSMSIARYTAALSKEYSFGRLLRSKTIVWFYGVIVVLLLLGIMVICCNACYSVAV